MFTVLLAACGYEGDEVARVTSPDDKLDAIVLELNGGATTSFGYEIYVSPKGSNYKKGVLVGKLYDTRRNTEAYGVNAEWDSASTLDLEYLESKEEELVKEKLEIADQEIVVRLKPGQEDKSAPPGGMFYNMQNRN